MRDPNTRALLIEAVIAGGLIAIGIPSGQVPLLALATVAAGMGGNWAYSLAQRGFRHWYEGWFTDEGVLNRDIEKALCQAYIKAAKHLEQDWKPHYEWLQRKDKEEAEATVHALRRLREEGANLLLQPKQLTQVSQKEQLAQQEQHERALSFLYQNNPKAGEYLKQALREYLEGTRAWRACQLLWQKSLMLGIDQIQQTADAVRWLQEWAQQLNSLPPTQRNPFGQDALEDILHSVHAQLDEMQNTLNKTYTTTMDIKATLEQVYPKGVPASKAKLEPGHLAVAPDRLHALLSDYGFIRVCSFIDDFVGRDRELREIRLQIDMLLPKGGYLTITGLAGQGKSSIIAKLVEEHSLEKTAYHFIPVNPPPDHQISLLLDVMARLILKHDLPDDWYVADLSLLWLRQSFAKLLKQIAGKGKQEVIFIDGLDLLREDTSGERGVNFLPDRLPEGVVLVLSTRPDNTLFPLELYQPHITYQLPRLSRPDFDLLLEQRGGMPDILQADQLYQVMQGNSLFLDLVAKELAYKDGATPEAIIKRVSDNPGNVFTLSMNRLGRSWRDDTLWNNVIKPTLGVLLAAREQLAGQHIRHIIGVDADRFSQGVQRLRGLIVADGQQRYTLFHPKLYDYLRQDTTRPQKDYIFALDEEQGWHQRLAAWCERGGIESLWQKVRNDPTEQERRAYAQRHYITHLYEGHEWQHLFDVLDAGRFGQAKVQADPNLRSFARDLDLGRRAAAWEGWTLEEGIVLLPCLWRYTLLYSSLTRRADQYPPGAFEMPVYFKRHRTALDLTGLLTDPVKTEARTRNTEIMHCISGANLMQWRACCKRIANSSRNGRIRSYSQTVTFGNCRRNILM